MHIKSFLAFAIAATVAVHAQNTADPYKRGGAGSDAGAGLAPLGAGGGAGIAAPEQSLEENNPTFLSVREETFSLPIEAAYELLHKASSDADLYAKVVEQMKRGEARIERLIVLRTKSGQRAVVESISELRYATEFDVKKKERQLPRANTSQKTPEPPAPPASASADEPFGVSFDTRNVGDTIELEPVLGPDGQTIDLNLVPQSVRFAGYQQPTKESWAKQPLFQTQKLTTSITARAGVPTFLGTLNPPFANGLAIEEKEQRVWLDFLTTDVVSAKSAPLAQNKTAELAKSILLTQLDFREATVSEALDFLRKKSVELDPTKQGVNLIARIPPSFTPAKITLTLKNVSLFDAVRLIAKSAGLNLVQDENALVVQ